MSWTEERIDLLKKFWSEGLSASQIASRLTGISRNAVIGKVHRLGLAGRATTSRMSTRRTRPRSGPPKQTSKSRLQPLGNPAFRALYQFDADVFYDPVEDIVIPLAERKTIQSLVECSCRWPIGDPRQSDFHFCGRNKVQGLPYCDVHARRAFQPPQTTRRPRNLEIPLPASLQVSKVKESADV